MYAKIRSRKIKIFYNNVDDVWGNHDPWHDYSKEFLSNYINKQNCFKNSIVLNAGSAGNTYGIMCKLMYHVDIADEKSKI